MLFTLRYCTSITLLILLLFKADPSGAQPSLLNKHITVNYFNQPVSVILQKLSKETGIRFSYDPDVIPVSRIMTLKVVNQPLSDVLKILFEDPKFLYHEMGNQLVIYRDRPSVQASNQSESAKVPPEGKPPQTAVGIHGKQVVKPVPDTVFLHRTDTLLVTRTDTLIKSETIILHDTIIHTDTVYLERYNKAQKAGRPVDPGFDKNSMKNQKFRKNNGFYAGISYEQLIGNPSYTSSSAEYNDLTALLKNSASGNAMNYSVGAIVGYDYFRLGIRSGISYTRLGESFEYSFTRQDGGFYKTDTVENYYTLSGVDTTWYYITDSSWVNINYKNYSYKNPNAYRYIEIPIMLRFRIIQGEKAELYGIGGIITGMYIGSRALTIQQEAGNPVIWTSSPMMSQFVFSWQAGAGTTISISNGIGVFAEVMYRKQLNEQFKNYPVQKKIGLLNIKTGIFVRF